VFDLLLGANKTSNNRLKLYFEKGTNLYELFQFESDNLANYLQPANNDEDEP